MTADADIAAVGAALADESRAAMLLALLGGDALSAGELARIAGRSPSGATAHLRALREAGLVVAEDAGRNRFFRLAGTDVAEALERARTCYDHLAGGLGVAVTEALVARRLLERADDSFRVTGPGAAWLRGLDIDVAALERQRRSFARVCLDWTERRPHLAGSLGAAVAGSFFDRGWVRRLPGGRAIAVSRSGSDWLARELGIAPP